MDRRSFLKTSALGGTAAAATTLAAPLYAQGKRTLTMVTAWPRGFAVLDDAATYLNNMVNEMSDGSLTIEKKAPGELVGAFEVFDAVSSGQADITRLITISSVSTPGWPISPPFHSVAQRKS